MSGNRLIDSIAIACVALLVAVWFEPAQAGPAEAAGDDSARANAFFDEAFHEIMMRSPMFQSRLGIKKDYDKWDDLSEAHAEETLAIVKRQLATLRKIVNYDSLDAQTKVSYELFFDEAERRMANHRFRYHNYPVNQMFGWQSQVPAFLINYHRIDSPDDARAYIKRLDGVPRLFDQVISGLDIRAEQGIIAPKFVFSHVLSDCYNVITGAPFDDSDKGSTLLSDFTDKVSRLDIGDKEKSDLIAQARKSLLTSVRPAYEMLIAYVTGLERRATTDDGAWKLPNGGAFYKQALNNTTTTELSADEIHSIGLAEVKRIHDEMRAIMTKVGYDGTLEDFFKFMREDKQFYYDETEDGKAAYLAKATDIIDVMREQLDQLFLTEPKAAIEVKPVEPFREKTAGKAFYQRPSPDGARPGVYYANLYRMADMPKYQMEALAYHEGIPGHHMQLAIALELEGIPVFRKYAHYSAHVEGWALYCEYLPKEIGFYDDPYSDFGRLAMELWRACRLVVDTGIHSKKWTREKAIDYLTENTPNPRGDSVKAIERYIVMPGQATAYKIGMRKIMELREKAKSRLGDRFDIREFHDVILENGPVPLDVLEQLVEAWVAEKRA